MGASPSTYLPSVMVVFGWRAAVALLTNRPVMADRLPVALLGTVWWTVVLGDRAAVRAVTKRPERALRATDLAN